MNDAADADKNDETARLPVAGPSVAQIVGERSAALGIVMSTHRATLYGALGLIGVGLLGVIIGGGLTVLELMGELEKPWLGVPVGLGFFGFGVWRFWTLRDDLRMRVDVRERGIVFTRAHDERVIAWHDVVQVRWLQNGSVGTVALVQLMLDLRDGSTATLPLERLSDVRRLTGAISERMRVAFPKH